MDQAISIVRLIEEITYQQSNKKNAIGSFQSVQQLLDSAEVLQAKHRGLFAFLAFHAALDHAIAEYVGSSSVSSDAGSRIMVLLLSTQPCDFTEDVTPTFLVGNVVVSYETHPANQLVERIFPDDPSPVLPGLLIFDALYGVGNAVYVSLAPWDSSRDVGDVCRKAFSFASQSYENRGSNNWTDLLAAKLTASGIGFQRSGEMHSREWLAHAFNLAAEYGTALVSLVPKIAGKLLGL